MCNTSYLAEHLNILITVSVDDFSLLLRAYYSLCLHFLNYAIVKVENGGSDYIMFLGGSKYVFIQNIHDIVYVTLHLNK